MKHPDGMRIPVLGLGECVMHLACMLGRRFGVLSHTAAFNIKFHENLIEKYGLGKHAGPLVSFKLPFEELEAGLRGNPQPALTASGKQVGKLLPGALK